MTLGPALAGDRACDDRRVRRAARRSRPYLRDLAASPRSSSWRRCRCRRRRGRRWRSSRASHRGSPTGGDDYELLFTAPAEAAAAIRALRIAARRGGHARSAGSRPATACAWSTRPARRRGRGHRLPPFLSDRGRLTPAISPQAAGEVGGALSLPGGCPKNTLLPCSAPLRPGPAGRRRAPHVRWS